MRNVYGVWLLTSVSVLAACSSRQTSKTTPRTDSTITAERQLKLTAEVLAPLPVTDSAALEAEFKDVQTRYPRVGDYLSRQKALTVLAAATATQSCNTFRDRFILTTAAQAYRRSLCPDHVLTPAEGLVVFPSCIERCMKIASECLHYPPGSEIGLHCLAQASACRSACP